VLRAREVLQVVLAPVQQPRADREVIGDQGGGRRRHQDLAAVADRQEPGYPIE
jgi:hypothetical protein